MMTETEFQALAAQGYNRIPLVLETFADLDTPLSLYLKLAQQHYTFLLEVDGGVKADNIESIAAAGADTFVAGSAIFGGGDYRAKIAAMRAALARTTGSA